MSDMDEANRISPPEPHRAADLARAVGRAVAGAIPVVGSAASEAVNLLPDPSARSRRDWERRVSDGVNDLSDRVGELGRRAGPRTIEITGAVAAAAQHMITSCPDGLADEWTTVDDLQAAFPEFTRDELTDAMGELEMRGWVMGRRLIGASPRFKLDEDAYAVLDPPIMGWSAWEDAKALAREVLTLRDTVSVPELDRRMGWPRRRFNPALRIVVGFVGDDRVSQTIQPDYVTRHFAPNAAERAALRAFAT